MFVGPWGTGRSRPGGSPVPVHDGVRRKPNMSRVSISDGGKGIGGSA